MSSDELVELQTMFNQGINLGNYTAIPNNLVKQIFDKTISIIQMQQKEIEQLKGKKKWLSQQGITVISLLRTLMPNTIVQVIRTTDPSTSWVNEIVDMEGASRMIIVERLEDGPTQVIPMGPDFMGPEITDGDTNTFHSEISTGLPEKTLVGVFDFGASILPRSVFTRVFTLSRPSGNFVNLVYRLSDDNINYGPPVAELIGTGKAIDNIIVTAVFRYVKIEWALTGGALGEINLYELGVATSTKLSLQIKNDANFNIYQTLKTLPSLSHTRPGQIKTRVTHIGPDIIEIGGDNSSEVKVNMFLPNLSGQMRLVDANDQSRSHAITVLKIFTGA